MSEQLTDTGGIMDTMINDCLSRIRQMAIDSIALENQEFGKVFNAYISAEIYDSIVKTEKSKSDKEARKKTFALMLSEMENTIRGKMLDIAKQYKK